MSNANFWTDLHRTLVIVVGPTRTPSVFAELRRRISVIQLYFYARNRLRVPLELAFALSTLLVLICHGIRKLRWSPSCVSITFLLKIKQRVGKFTYRFTTHLLSYPFAVHKKVRLSHHLYVISLCHLTHSSWGVKKKKKKQLVVCCPVNHRIYWTSPRNSK